MRKSVVGYTLETTGSVAIIYGERENVARFALTVASLVSIRDPKEAFAEMNQDIRSPMVIFASTNLALGPESSSLLLNSLLLCKLSDSLVDACAPVRHPSLCPCLQP